MLYMYVPVCVRVRRPVLEVLQNIQLKICVHVNRLFAEQGVLTSCLRFVVITLFTRVATTRPG